MYDRVSVVSTKEHLQIKNGRGPCVRRSKRPLPSQMSYGNLSKFGERSSSVIRSRLGI